jgi:hypothetical protein
MGPSYSPYPPRGGKGGGSQILPAVFNWDPNSRDGTRNQLAGPLGIQLSVPAVLLQAHDIGGLKSSCSAGVPGQLFLGDGPVLDLEVFAFLLGGHAGFPERATGRYTYKPYQIQINPYITHHISH